MKCEFSAAEETRAAPLPVIGLAPFPKNPSLLCPPSPASPIQSRSSIHPSLHSRSPCRPAHVYAAVSWALPEHGKAGGMVFADTAACGPGFSGGLIEEEGLRGLGG